ncbi:metal-dependent hydrolase [Verrucomicrobiota bacterium sgz303538]
MATVLSHAIAAIALKTAFPTDKVPPRLWLLGAVCAMAPDIDVLGFRFGIAYGDLFGHRGFTHSLLFAGLLGLLGTFAAFPRRTSGAHRGVVWIYLFLATASHGLLDALTDGGHGIAFFAPFENSRYFFPVTPIAVSPIGLSGFFSSGGWQVLASEARWIWLPSLLCAVVAWLLRSSVVRHPASATDA